SSVVHRDLPSFPTRRSSDLAGPVQVSPPSVKLTVSSLAIANGRFEAGNFSGWITNDVAQSYIPLAVLPNGFTVGGGVRNLVTRQIEGDFSAAFGFDGGSSGGRIRMAQDVAIKAAAPLLTFDYAAVWDGVSIGGAVPSRVFKVTIEPSG